MMTRNRLGLTVITAAILAVCTIAVSGLYPASAEAAPKQKIVVHLSHYTDNLHSAMMAVHFAEYMQEHGSDVTLLLDVDGVRLADQRQPQDSAAGMSGQISTRYDSFVKAGGKVLVCPHCAEVAGLTTQNLRPGAHLAKNLGEFAEVILAADKTLDY